MRLEYSYKGYFITLLSYPVEGGWVAQFQARKPMLDKEEVHTLTDKLELCFSSLAQANERARKLARVWVDQREKVAT
jgi:hypothetical protein